MNAADLRAWQAHMGYTQAQAAEALGVALGTYCEWVAGVSRTTGRPIAPKKTVALACAALAAGMRPWPEGR
jgi:DNA-binding XRE family transcriptional regulator